MIEITPEIAIDEKEIEEEFVRSSGPGGQNVNKVATAVQLRFDVNGSSLPVDLRERLKILAGSRLTEGGILIVQARRHRTQERNRSDALNQFIELVQRAARKPKVRHKTKPSRASQQRRLESKRHRSEVKQSRRSVPRSEN